VTGTIDMTSSVFSHGSAAGRVRKPYLLREINAVGASLGPSPSPEVGPHQHSGMARPSGYTPFPTSQATFVRTHHDMGIFLWPGTCDAEPWLIGRVHHGSNAPKSTI
jgi:hypothetical protein